MFGAGLNLLPYDHNIEGFKRDLKEGPKFSCSDRTCDCGDTEDHEGCCCNSEDDGKCVTKCGCVIKERCGCKYELTCVKDYLTI